jgi:hypothetical protein
MSLQDSLSSFDPSSLVTGASVHITLPKDVFDYTIHVPLRRGLTETELKNYVKMYEEWLKGQIPSQFFRDNTHYLKLFAGDNGSDQWILVYCGCGVSTDLTVVESSYLGSTEYKLKRQRSIAQMKERMYVFARCMYLPIQTSPVESFDGKKHLEVVTSLVQPHYILAEKITPHRSNNPQYKLEKHQIHKSFQNKAAIYHSPDEISIIIAPRMEDRFKLIPSMCDKQLIVNLAGKVGYRFLRFVAKQ